jgi:putative membrane protein
MPLTRTVWLTVAVATLASVWFGPLPMWARHSFAAHMTMHMIVVAIGAPLIALAIAGTAADPVRRAPALVPPIPLAMVELVVVWTWHAPMLHHAARQTAGAFAAEQLTFLAAGVMLWIAAIGGDPEQRRLRAGGGIVALLFTSMHMTLLGALFALANRPLFHHVPSGLEVSVVADQHLGGVIMLLVGGASYLAGGLSLTADALRTRTA